jgi:N-ethylmaleimide reductase
MPTLVDPLDLGSLRLPNRMLMAPMTRSRANDAGVPSDLVPTYYQQRAGAGLIVTEATYVSPMAKGYVRTPGMHTAEQVAAWRRVTEAVHAAGGRIFQQFFHVGRISIPQLLPGGAAPVAPSAIQPKGGIYTDDRGLVPHELPRALETEEIPAIVEDFRRTTELAFEAGFDGVELHSASGYLHHQFLWEGSNQRTDRYGGSIENRTRFVLETLAAMASVDGPQRVGVKISPEMPFNDMKEQEAQATYESLVRGIAPRGLAGLAYLHVALFGTPVDYHGLLRPLVGGSYFAGGGLDAAKASALLESGRADATVFGALSLANPDLPERFRQGAALNKPDSSTLYSPGPKGYLDYPTLAER